MADPLEKFENAMKQLVADLAEQLSAPRPSRRGATREAALAGIQRVQTALTNALRRAVRLSRLEALK